MTRTPLNRLYAIAADRAGMLEGLEGQERERRWLARTWAIQEESRRSSRLSDDEIEARILEIELELGLS